MSYLSGLRTERAWLREIISEFVGTFFLVFLGNATMNHLVLKGQHDVLAVAFCWGLAVMFGILIGVSNSGGHVNPVVTVGFAAIGKFPWIKVPHYILGQYLGGFAACALLFGLNNELLNKFDGGQRVDVGVNGTGAIWTTYPDPNVSIGTCVLDTIVCSGTLMFIILAILDKDNAAVPGYLHSFYIALEVTVIVWALGVNCSAAINPARDFPPRVFAAMIGYKDAFGHRNFWWVPLFIPFVGGVLGSILYELSIGIHKPIKKAPLAEIQELKHYNEEAKPMV